MVITMRVSLAIIALLSNVTYGFSSSSSTIQSLGSLRPPSVVLSPTKKPNTNSLLLVPRGGAARLQAGAAPFDTGSKCPATGAAALFASIWGTGGVLYILSKAVKRVLPIALEPFQAGAVPLTSVQLGYG